MGCIATSTKGIGRNLVMRRQSGSAEGRFLASARLKSRR